MKRLARQRWVRRSIAWVAGNRPAGRGQVDANLMRAAGHQLTAKQCAPSGGLHDFVSRLTLGAGSRDDDAAPVLRIARERQPDDTTT